MDTHLKFPCVLAAVLLLTGPCVIAAQQQKRTAMRPDAPAWIAPTPPAAQARTPAVEPDWIWLPNEPERVWLSRTIELPYSSAQYAAHLWLAADNHAVALVNGQRILHSDDWSSPTSVDIALNAGRNVLAIEAWNGAGTGYNPAAVLARLDVTVTEGEPPMTFVTDESWHGASDQPWDGWPGTAVGEGGEAAFVIGPITTAPWNLSPILSDQTAQACPIMRRQFTLDEQPVRATLRVIGLGHYQLHCNGKPVGDTLINQTWSQYDKTLYWQLFDVTDLMQAGDNALGVLLGNSFWWVGPANDANRFVKTDAMPDFSGGNHHLLFLDLVVQTPQRTIIHITSDDHWRWTDGPLTFSHIYAGEDYDARQLPDGWDTAGYDDRDWQPVHIIDQAPSALQVPALSPGMTAQDVFEPSEILQPEPGVYTYVFPQNCSALLRFTLEGDAGYTVRFKPCEYMDESGKVKFTYTWGTGKDIWHDYTLRGGGGPEQHQILFCYVGSQYVEVSGAVPDGEPNPDNLPVLKSLELVHVRTDNREVGQFMCSSDLQNRAHHLIDWSIRSNMSHVPTDCPHREKNGWQEENWHMARAMSYRFDINRWYRKVAHDLRDTQLEDGHIPTNCPNYLVGIGPHGFWNEAPEWGISGVLVPWHLYEWYGDSYSLRDSYESMKRYVDYLATQAEDGIITSNLGDWYDYGHGMGDGPSRYTPQQVSATAMWAIGAHTVAKTAAVLGKPSDEEHYTDLFNRIRADFQRHFYDAQTKTVANNGSCQAAHAVALCADLVPAEDREAVRDAIVADLEAREYQQTTGEVLHVFLIRALAESDRGDVLHRVYARTEPGSYGYMVNSGLTTLPESWNARRGTGNSMNHFMLGHLMEWHYAYVAGIRQQPDSVGWRRIVLAPQPGPLTHAEATFDSPIGLISSKWDLADDGQFMIEVQIPDRATGTAILPDGSTHTIQPGQLMTLRCQMK